MLKQARLQVSSSRELTVLAGHVPGRFRKPRHNVACDALFVELGHGAAKVFKLFQQHLQRGTHDENLPGLDSRSLQVSAVCAWQHGGGVVTDLAACALHE